MTIFEKLANHQEVLDELFGGLHEIGTFLYCGVRPTKYAPSMLDLIRSYIKQKGLIGVNSEGKESGTYKGKLTFCASIDTNYALNYSGFCERTFGGLILIDTEILNYYKRQIDYIIRRPEIKFRRKIPLNFAKYFLVSISERERILQELLKDINYLKN
jgi:hypothetical protein